MASGNEKMPDVDFGAETELKLALTPPQPTFRKDETWGSAEESSRESLSKPRQSYRPTPPLKDSVKGIERMQRDSLEDRASSEMIRIGLTTSTIEGLQLTIPSPTAQLPERQAPEQPERPERPQRPSSLRLSSLTRQGTLTSNKVITVGRTLSRPGTAGTQRSTATRTNSLKRYSWQTTSEGKSKSIKYGQGKHGTIELVPQPSDAPEDPLNWCTRTKALHFYSLMMTVALTGVMKTVFVSVNGALARDFNASYTAVTVLTGVPLMLSAFTGLASLTVARLWGRRPVYLVSMASLFIGAAWNTNVPRSYGQCMTARMFQGLGWGAFDTLVLGSIYDTYFEHERQSKIAVYRIISTATTWGPPLLGGIASQSRTGFSLQFDIIMAFLPIAMLLLVFAVPETMFDRTASLLQTPVTAVEHHYPSPPWTNFSWLNKERILPYLKTIAQPVSYHGPTPSLHILLQAPKATIAPTTVLVFLASFLPFVSLWGLSSSLSLLFSVAPFQLLPATVGSLLSAPFILATAAVAGFFLLPQWHHSFGIRTSNLYALGAGSLLSFVGMIGFGLYAASRASAGAAVSFAAVSFLLGLLAAGAHVLDATSVPLINRSTTFTSPNLALAMRNGADMEGGLAVWRALSAGIFVMAVPSAVASADGLRSTGVGVAAVQLLVAGLVGAAWFMWDENFRRMDGKIMGCIDLAFLKRTGSFFDESD